MHPVRCVAMWDARVTALLAERGLVCATRAVRDGTQYRIESGEIIMVYKSGRIAFQGKGTPQAVALSRELKELGATVVSAPDMAQMKHLVSGGVNQEKVASLDSPASLPAVLTVAATPQTIEINVPLLEQLGSASRKAVRKAIQDFADDVAKEAERLELGERPNGSDSPEFTSKMIGNAERFVRSHPTIRKPTSKVDYASDAAFLISGPCFGLMGNYFHSAWQGALFSMLLVVWIVTLIRRLTRGKDDA